MDLLRSTVDDLGTYVDAWNLLLARLFLRDRRELAAAYDDAIQRFRAAGHDVTAQLAGVWDAEVERLRIRPREVPIDSIREIAIAVAGQPDRRSRLARIFLSFDPVAARFTEVREQFRAFAREPSASRREMARAIEREELPRDLNELYRLIEKASEDLLHREILLRDLASAGRNLADAAFPGGFLENRRRHCGHHLLPERIRRLAGYFHSQAEIDGVRFRTLHLASQQFYQVDYRPEHTVRFHRRLVQEALRLGYTRFVPTVRIERPRW